MSNMRYVRFLISTLLTIFLLFSILNVFIPSFSVSAGTLQWSEETNPTSLTYENTIVPNIDIIDIAASGNIIYAATSNSNHPLYKSTNGGANWTSLAASTSFPSGVSVKAVAIAPDDANVVAIITSANEVEYSTNGGTSWSDLEKPSDTSPVVSTTSLSAIDISPGMTRYIAVGGQNTAGDAELFTLKLAMAQTWQARYTGAAGIAPSQTDIKAVKYSPNFNTDKAIAVVSGDATTAIFQLFRYEAGDYEWNGSIDYLPSSGDGSWGTGVQLDTLTGSLAAAEITLPATYLANDEGERLVYTATAGVTSGGSVHRLTDVVLSEFDTWSGGDIPGCGSIAYSEEGWVVAGAYADNTVYQFLDLSEPSPDAIRINTLKQPGGVNSTIVTLSGSTVVAGTSGDESAFSISIDDGYSFNDVALIDTTLGSFDDFATSANGDKVYLTTHDTSDGSGTYDTSVWLKESSWIRVFSSIDIADANAPFLVRVAPEDDAAVYLSSKSSRNLWASKNSGMETWKSIDNSKVTGVQDFTVASTDVVYALDVAAGQGVSKTTNAGASWGTTKEPTGGINGYMITLASNGDILVGGSDGYISYSKDGGATFERTLSFGTGNTYVAAGDDYASNNIIYVGTGTSMKRGKADTSTVPVIRGSANWTITSIAQYEETTYFLSANTTQGSILYRCSNLETAGVTSFWSSTHTSKVFRSSPQALKVSLGPKLWAIESSTNSFYSFIDDYSAWENEFRYTETITYWTAEAVPDLTNNIVCTAGTDIVDLAANGDTVYACTNSTSSPLFKSTDGGVTWTSLAASTSFPSGVSVKAIAVAPDDANVVAIITSANEVEYSTNGGSSWTDLNVPSDTSPAVTANILSAIGISPGTTRYLAVGGQNTAGNAELFTIKLTMAQTWQARYISSTGIAPSQTDIKAVKYSPNYLTDKAIAVVSGNATNATFQLFRYETGDFEWNGSIDYLPEQDWGTGITLSNITGGLAASDIALPSLFLASNQSARLVYTAEAGTASGGSAHKLNDIVLIEFDTWSGSDIPACGSIAFNESGWLVAGDYNSNRVFQFLSLNGTSPDATQINLLKQPDGENRTVVEISGSNVITGTSGDESAIALSTDQGYSFNGVGLIDTTLSIFDDVAVSTSGDKVYLTTHDTTEGSGNYDTSVWLRELSWRRIFSCRDIADTNAAFLVRLAPEDDTVVYLSSKSSQDMWISNNSGSESWQYIPSTNVTAVQDFVVASANVVYTLDTLSDSGISKTTDAGITWGDPVKPGSGINGHMITLAPNGDILVGCSDGFISYSKDEGTTFERTQSFGAGNIYVAADDDYASNNIIYAGTDTSIKKGNADNTTLPVTSGSTSWSITSLIQHGETTYVLSANTTQGGMLYASSRLETAESSEEAGWNSINFSHTFNSSPQALKISSGPKLWTVEQDGGLYSYTETPILTTFAATNTTSSSTALSGNLDSLGTAGSVIVSFEWGNIPGSLAQETATQVMNTTGTFSISLSSLFSNTTYYFRAKGLAGSVEAYGYELSFTTTGTPSISPEPPPENEDEEEVYFYSEIELAGTTQRLFTSYDGTVYQSVEMASPDGILAVEIPKGTVIKAKHGRRLQSLNIAVNNNPPPIPDDKQIIGLTYEFRPTGATFDPPVKLSLKYDPATIPQSLYEEDLVLAFYDEEISEWIELESTVDTKTHTVSANISHLSSFAILGQEEKAPAALSLFDLKVTPSEVYPGEVVTIDASVANTGRSKGTIMLTLKINEIDEDTKKINVEAGDSETFSFRISRQEAGIYSVNVNGFKKNFIVVPLPISEPEPILVQETINFLDSNLERVIRAENMVFGKGEITTAYITKENLEAIKHLSGTGEKISDLSGLEYCINLESLFLSYNDINDLTPLKSLVSLKQLSLSYNQIDDLSALAELRNLEVLNLSNNEISDISILINMPKLNVLDLSRNNICEISSLAGLVDLNVVILGHNKITDIAPIVNNQGISDINTLDISDNPLDRKAYDEYIPELKVRVKRVIYDEKKSPIPDSWWWIIGIVIMSAIVITTLLRKRYKLIS